MKKSVLALLLMVAGIAMLAVGSLYFGAPMFGWLIIAAIALIFIGTAFRDIKVLKAVENDTAVLNAQIQNGSVSEPASGLVADRVRGIKELAKSGNASVETCLDLLNAKFALKLGKSAGGVVILLGLMGTFFGLMLSVTTAGSSIDNSSTAATMESVHSIFSSMKGIFGTSLCGILASLILSAIHTLLKNNVEAFAADLDFYTVSKLYPAYCVAKDSAASYEEGLVKQMTESLESSVQMLKASFAESQEASAESMLKVSNGLNDNFTKLVAEVSEKFAGTRAETLEAMQAMLSKFAGGLSSAIENTIAKVQGLDNTYATALRENIASLSAGINDSLVRQSAVASEEWKTLMARFAEIADKSAAAEAEHLASLHGASAGLSETLAAEIAKINSNVESAIKSLGGELAASVKSQVEESNAQWNSFMAKLEAASMESSKGQREGLETLANVAVQVAEKAQAGSADLSTRVTEEISKLSADVQTSFKSLAETSAALVEAQKQLLEGVENRVVKENEASETLTSNINEASTLMRVNQSEFSAGLEMFNKGLESLLEKLSGDTEEKGEEEGFVEQIRRSLELFHERASEILMENAVKTQEILLEILEQSQRSALTAEAKKEQ